MHCNLKHSERTFLFPLFLFAEDLTFDIRLTNGTDTAGRVEVKVKGNWTSLCGTDLTQKEARVICRELGYHEGRVMTPGYYGAGTKSQFVTDIRCDGTDIANAYLFLLLNLTLVLKNCVMVTIFSGEQLRVYQISQSSTLCFE